ncbi:ABC transporter ATP-binding protein [Tengunoibacter tsumagoiensis]|uniref:ABC transporter ATP-binding protein n=1 Tax=Tengunoibacter tsumagoiensis TaxID=2014871 RepID=A0A402A391_9CHLR|nr:ABC transporter ATP-binding protein [Tengunoibacter tsumagoiensis]GCE13620.1 ABC transporter ATP-binding protein [Tengunoibacter tsumagoiensis]
MADTLTTLQSPGQKIRSDEVVLSIQHLTKQYGQRLAVNDLSLDVHRGDIFGFLGPNGAGKTTTIRMIFGLITPTSGKIEMLGQDLAHHRSHVLPRVGALIETPALYLYMSGIDNLRAVAATLGGVPKERYQTVLELVGLTGREKDRVRTYSLGMKQRLGLAIALLQDPEVLILDEPANGLDPAGIVEMRDLMHRLSEAGKTVLISSHLLSEVQQICSRVAIINRGKLVTETTVSDLTRGQGEFEIRLEQPEQALALLRQQPWGQQAKISEKGTILTQAPLQRGRDLNLFLVNAGFVPESLAPATLDLEQVFLQLTGSQAGDVR